MVLTQTNLRIGSEFKGEIKCGKVHHSSETFRAAKTLKKWIFASCNKAALDLQKELIFLALAK